MRITSKLIESSVGRYANLCALKRVLSVGITYTTPNAINLGEGECGFLWKGYACSNNGDNLVYFNILIDGAQVFHPGLCMPSYPGVQNGPMFGWTCCFDNMWFPPHSEIRLRFYNASLSVCEAYASITIYKFYKKELERDYTDADCPLWLKEPPAWFVKVLENVSGVQAPTRE